MSVITNTFRFESRSDWWWKKYEVFDSLHRELKYEGVREEEVSRKMSVFLKEYGEKWVRFGKPQGVSGNTETKTDGKDATGREHEGP